MDNTESKSKIEWIDLHTFNFMLQLMVRPAFTHPHAKAQQPAKESIRESNWQ